MYTFVIMRLIFLLIILAGVYYHNYGGGFSFGGGGSYPSAAPVPAAMKSDLNEAPVQKSPASAKGVKFKQGRLNFLADYKITARVLSKKYYRGGKEGSIAPLDLAMGWKYMANPSVYGRLNIRQSGRFYRYRWQGAPPIPERQIITSSANMHIIPADKGIEKQLADIKAGDVVTLTGYLVHYREGDSRSWWEWKSSTTRGDTGKGACELMYVVSVQGG